MGYSGVERRSDAERRKVEKRLDRLEDRMDTFELSQAAMSRQLDDNTRITKGVDSKVGEVLDFATAVKVNAKIIAWIAIPVGALAPFVLYVLGRMHG